MLARFGQFSTSLRPKAFHRVPNNFKDQELGAGQRIMATLQILHLEDNLADAELCFETLTGAGINCDIVRVDSQADFVKRLREGSFDLIISDFSLPHFDGKSALAFAHKHYPDTPFIFVSGTIGEDAAIESLVSGATD